MSTDAIGPRVATRSLRRRWCSCWTAGAETAWGDRCPRTALLYSRRQLSAVGGRLAGQRVSLQKQSGHAPSSLKGLSGDQAAGNPRGNRWDSEGSWLFDIVHVNGSHRKQPESEQEGKFFSPKLSRLRALRARHDGWTAQGRTNSQGCIFLTFLNEQLLVPTVDVWGQRGCF